MFLREAQALSELAEGPGPRYPEVFLHGPEFLLLEDLAPASTTTAPASKAGDYDAVLGRQLAQQHSRLGRRFGFHHDNYIGSTPQPNAWMENGFDFFAERRLLFQAGLAQDNGLLARGEVRQVEHLSKRLPELLPEQPASLLHGDLWGGNAISDRAGQPALIDPAAYYGWAEADLAMTRLFGGFGRDFYRAYEEAAELESGWRDRLTVYNLYHLLNHLNIFGRSYHGQVQEILRRYT